MKLVPGDLIINKSRLNNDIISQPGRMLSVGKYAGYNQLIVVIWVEENIALSRFKGYKILHNKIISHWGFLHSLEKQINKKELQIYHASEITTW